MNTDTTKQATPIKTRVSGNKDIESSLAPSTIRGDIWYSDGSVILQAGQTQFRVHKSILEACSSVFKDMFSLSQPEHSDSEGTIDGCPVVYLHDPAQDLALLLEAIYRHPNSGVTPTADLVIIRFEMLSVMLRLGNKYDIPHLRDNALYRIRAEYAPEPHDLSLDHFVYFSSDDAVPFEIVRLAYEEGVFSVLPVALLHIAVYYNVKQIFAGVERDDGTRATLPLAMIRACLEGRE
ncbi:hypothetical protein BJ165DRAFT_1534199 [Panaeolus papilionaceus]|nr:hypothetical protein BJ165DRAFT_1534199 [Panaeolus papilionaceus]